MALINDILKGDIPEVPLKVTVEDRSIIKLSVAIVIVVTICLLMANLLKRKK